jgi:hypothetical protein
MSKTPKADKVRELREAAAKRFGIGRVKAPKVQRIKKGRHKRGG